MSIAATVKAVTVGSVLVMASAAAAVLTPPMTLAATSYRIYAANYDSNTVSIIDGTTHNVIGTVPVGQHPINVLPSTDGSTLYVANYTNCCSFGPGTLSVVDTHSMTVTATIPINDNPVGLALKPDGTTLYVSNNVQCPNGGCHSAISVIDTATNTVTANIVVDPNAWGLSMSPDGTRLYISNGGTGVDIIDTATSTLLYLIPDNGGRAIVSPDGSKLYLTTGGCNYGVNSTCTTPPNELHVYDTATNQMTAIVALGGSPYPLGVVRNSTGTRLYIAHTGQPGSLDVVDTTSNHLVANISVGADPNEVAISPDDTRVYVTNSSEGTISVVDTTSNAVIGQIGAGGGFPWGVAVGNNTGTRRLTALSPAKVWIGLKNSDDVGIKFDLLAEAYQNTNVVSRGELTSFSGGSSGFNNAHIATIPFAAFPAADFPSGSPLTIKLYVRNACSGSGKNSGQARLWYNDSAADSQFGATIDATTTYYLHEASQLGTTIGTGPKKTVDVQAGAKCSPYKAFGSWTITS